MFTGLIREVGKVAAFRKKGREALLEVSCSIVLEDAKPGESVAVDGACLTVETLSGSGFSAFVSAETLDRTTLGSLRPGTPVNLEPALRPSDRLGGHVVQGHGEGVGRVTAAEKAGAGSTVRVALPRELLPYVVPKGSVALDGVSLTVADLSGDELSVALIPSTLGSSTAGSWRPGRGLNVETDLVGRYIVSYLRRLGAAPGLTMDDLVKKGF